MYLALGGTCSNRAPCHEVGEVLRGDDVEELAPGRQSAPGEIQQQPARQVQAAVDAEAAIQVRIVDQSLPAHRGARLFEIDTHHDLQRATEAFALLPQSPGVVHRCGNVMDRAGTYHHGQAIVLAVRSEEHTSELQSLMRISYAVFCLKKK